MLPHAVQCMHLRIRNLVNKLLPKFKSNQIMVKKKPGVIKEADGPVGGPMRKLNSKTTHAMPTWSHFCLHQRLLQKSRSYPGCTVVVVMNKPCTSKMCGGCIKTHQIRGSNKVFCCKHMGCRCVSDRDMNGSRNILLLYLVLCCTTRALRSTPAQCFAW